MKQCIYKLSIALLLGTAALSMSSCQFVNKYRSPEIESEALFRDEVPPADTATIADIPWSRYFADPILVSLIDEGLAANHDLQIAYTRIEQAEANLRISRASYFPSVSLAGQVQQQRASDHPVRGRNELGYHNTAYTLGIGVTWEADIWGKINRQNRADYAAFLNSQSYRDLVQTSLIANIATTYYSLLALDRQLEITEQTVAILDESAETMQALMDAGMLTGAAVHQSRSLYFGTAVTIPDLKARIRETENSLSVMLGRTPGPIERSSLDDQQVNALMDAGVPVQMLARRPDVQSAELSFRRAFELTNVARASFYPAITLNSGSLIGYSTTNSLSQFFKPENLIANIIGGVTMPLFARRQLNSNLKIAKATQQEALLTFEKTVLTAGQEVSDILYGYRSSLDKNADRTRQVESLETSVYFTKELLKAGEANYTEVLSAEQSLLQAQLGQVNDKLQQLQYSVTLYKALGGGAFR